MNALRIIVGFFVIGLVVLTGFSADDAGTTRDRASLITELKIDVVRPLSADTEAAKDMSAIARYSFEQNAKKELPEVLNGADPGAIDTLMHPHLILRYNNAEYVKLLARKAILDIRILLEFQRRFEPLSSNERLALGKAINEFVDSIRATTHKYVDKYIRSADIDAHVDSIREDLVGHIGDRNSYYLTRVPTPDRLVRLFAEFDERLAKTKDAIPQRLRGGMPTGPIVLPSKKQLEPLRGSGGASTQIAPSVNEINAILNEITRPAVSIFLDATSKPELKALDPNELVPGYAEAVKGLNELEMRLVASADATEATRATNTSRSAPNSAHPTGSSDASSFVAATQRRQDENNVPLAVNENTDKNVAVVKVIQSDTRKWLAFAFAAVTLAIVGALMAILKRQRRVNH